MNIFEDTKPTSIFDFIADSDRELRKLDLIVTNQITFPSDGKRAILLHGKYGSGKTQLAKLLPFIMEKSRTGTFDPKQFEDIGTVFLSCQATGGSQLAKLATPTTLSFHQTGLHYVILDEVDNLRADAQKNMKSFITEYKHVVYIMTTNHLSKVDNGLRSRSHCVSFENPCQAKWLQKCRDMLFSRAINFDESFLEELVERSDGDARNILSEIENYVMLECA